MRYLYGDLTEFPQQENTLDLLRRFVTMGVALLQMDATRGASQQIIEDDREFLAEAIGDINEFQKTVRHVMQEAVSGRTESDGEGRMETIPADLIEPAEMGALEEFGRREEIYIAKSEIVDRIRELPPALRVLFTPLQLEV